MKRFVFLTFLAIASSLSAGSLVLSSDGGADINTGAIVSLYTVPTGKALQLSQISLTTDSSTPVLAKLQADGVTKYEAYVSSSNPVLREKLDTAVFPAGSALTLIWPTATGKHAAHNIIALEDDASKLMPSSFLVSTSVPTGSPTPAPPAKLAASTFTPGAGSYESSIAMTVTLSHADGSAHIFYTKDGTNPTHSGDTATGTTTRIGSNSGTTTVPTSATGRTTTIKAIAYKSGTNDSDVVSATYTVYNGSDPTGGGEGGHQLN